MDQMSQMNRIREQQQRERYKAANGARLKKKRKKNHALHYILLLILTIVIGITLSVTVFFNIEIINVQGAVRYAAQDIISSSAITTGKNLFRINTDNIAKAIMNQRTDLDSVAVSRGLPATLNIEIVESQPVAVVYDAQTYYTLSVAGRIIDVSSTKPEQNVIELYGITMEGAKLGDFVKDREDNSSYSDFDKLTQAITESGIKGIDIIDLSNPSAIKMYWEKRIEVILGNMNDLKYKFDFAAEILNNKIPAEETGVLDVSKTGNGYYRVKPIELPQTVPNTDNNGE